MTWQASLSPVDYLVAVVILLVPVGIGIYYAIKDVHHVTRVEYLLGGRRMSSLPVAMSLFVTYQSAVSFMGVPSEVYTYGFIYILVTLAMGLQYAFATLAVVPLMYPLKITSVNEYLSMRYKSEGVRLMCTTFGIISTTIYMAIALLSPALAIQACADVPLWISILVLGAAGTLYTAIGGIKSVIWTDAFQCAIILIGLAIILVKTFAEVGGIGEVWKASLAGERLQFNRFSPDPRIRHSVWGIIVGLAFIWGSTIFNQSTIQRVSCMKSLHQAKRAYAIAGVFLVTGTAALCCMGLLIFVYFSLTGCDPQEAGYISNQNQIAPYFVLHSMAEIPGVAGLFISVLCCGCLSTLSSGINALATLTVEDILGKPLRSLDEKTITNITKVIALAFGFLIIGLTHLFKSMKGNVAQLANTFVASIVSPTLGIFLMGASVPWANKYGAFVGAAVSFPFNMWINIGSQMFGKGSTPLPSIASDNCLNESRSLNFSDPLPTEWSIDLDLHDAATDTDSFSVYDISYEWFTVTSTLLCVIVGLSASQIANRLNGLSAGKLKPGWNTTDASYIFPGLRRCWALKQPRTAQYYVAKGTNCASEHGLVGIDEDKI